jgi:hypothetical protein
MPAVMPKICEATVTGPFTTGSFASSIVLVSSEDALGGTSIAAAASEDLANVNFSLSSEFLLIFISQIRVYYLSPPNILSERVYNGENWVGYSLDILASKILYAMYDLNGSPSVIRVGYMSDEGVLSEAVYKNSWSFAPLY